MASGYVLLAWPSLLVIVRSFVLSDAAPEQTALFFHVRSPHHYDLAAFSAQDAFWLASLALLAAPVLGRVTDTGAAPERIAALRALAFAMAAVLLVGLLGSLLHIQPIVRAFAWRMSVPLGLLLLLCAGAGLRAAIASRRLPLLSLYLAGVVWLSSFSVSQALPWRERPSAVAKAWARFTTPSLRAPPGGQLGKLHRWVREQSPADARFLVPPGFIDFRLHARRAIFVDWKCTPMRGDELVEWRRRMLAAMGTTRFPAVGYALRHGSTRAYERQPLERLAALARREGLTHVIARPAAPAPGLTPLERVGRFQVYRLD
jgi:hypothetical protein